MPGSWRKEKGTRLPRREKEKVLADISINGQELEEVTSFK